MKDHRSTGLCKPFKKYKKLLESKVGFGAMTIDSNIENYNSNLHDPEQEIERQFFDAMADVTPIKKNTIKTETTPLVLPKTRVNQDAKVITQLYNLVHYGKGFVVADTPEYVEGRGYGVAPEISRRLHQGYYSIQAYLDLHGLNVEVAKKETDIFLDESIRFGKRAVLIVHGRGLTSPGKPVLKYKVIQWLTKGRWRKWVVAFTSARLCDGRAGGTYILLRDKPYKKNHRPGR